MSESLFREPLASNPRRNEIVAIVRIYWLAAALAAAYPPAKEPEGAKFSFYNGLGMVSTSHVKKWLTTIHATTDEGEVAILNDSFMPDACAGDGGFILLAGFWEWLHKRGYEMEKTPEALWLKLRPECLGPIPAWLVKHKPKTGGTPGPKPDRAKTQAYNDGWESLREVIRHIHTKQGKVPTLGDVAAELVRRYPKTARSVWRNQYLTGVKPAEYIGSG